MLAQLAQLDANGDDDDSDEDEEITHSVPFKCIGAAHEKTTNIIWNKHTLLLIKIHQ